MAAAEAYAASAPWRRVDRLWSLLTSSLVVLLALALGHDGDHLVNRATLGDLGVTFWLLLPLQYAAFGFTIWLIARRDPRGPRVAALLCGIVVVGFIGAHVLPFGLAPYSDSDPAAISWALVFVPLAAAACGLALAVRLIRPRPCP